MQPVIYSVKDAMEGQPRWVRAGHDVCYYKNNYARSFAASGSKGKSYYTSAFKIVFPYDKDIVYMAYHYPYTYTTLQVCITILTWRGGTSGLKCDCCTRLERLLPVQKF